PQSFIIHSRCNFFFLLIPRPARSTLFPYTTLFRSSSEWVRQHQNLLLIGPTGIGKSWLACALAHKACRDGCSVLHKRTAELFREDRKSTRLNSSHVSISYAVFCLKKKIINC